MITLALMLAAGGCGDRERPTETSASVVASPLPRFQRQQSWAGKGVWLRADTHTHTKFSDGSRTVAELIEQAREHGCDVVAITDHADQNLSAATPEYRDAILAARVAHPEMVILAGLEWNVPPYGGDEHATLLVPTTDQEWDVLTGFKARFDDYKRGEQPAALADEGLRWLDDQYSDGSLKPVVFLNHPSRKRDSPASVLADLKRWRGVSQIVAGMSGAPGHQRGDPNGAYQQKIQTVERWDPVVEVGAEWDQLLQAGHDVWAARAPSDVHQPEGSGALDYWPGQFSETWIYAADRSTAAVIQALRAGSFFAAHGRLVSKVELTVMAPGLQRSAQAGEAIEVAAGTELSIQVACQIPEEDWEGAANHLDQIELIGIQPATDQVARILTTHQVEDGNATLSFQLPAPAAGLVVRARGRRQMETGGDYQFHTNPIRIEVP